ncbi:hypothetical protein HGRIS_005252 [Hohenbuehelia grisea]|uniref:Uncharacterized protein n=1 Tax=Hohenbuehelia grisea TaxID=104357 RepID=A0ABR3JFB6_9AGAR
MRRPPDEVDLHTGEYPIAEFIRDVAFPEQQTVTGDWRHVDWDAIFTLPDENEMDSELTFWDDGMEVDVEVGEYPAAAFLDLSASGENNDSA